LAVWAMLLGMVTLIDVTMVGALMSLAGNIPDMPLLHILSRYLKKKDEPSEALLHPLEAASRLARLRKRILGACIATAVMGAGLSVWALSEGWGTVAMLAITCLVIAGNLLFDSIPLASWRRRVLLMNPDMDIDETDADSSVPPR
jgi:hypothetical protein